MCEATELSCFRTIRSRYIFCMSICTCTCTYELLTVVLLLIWVLLMRKLCLILSCGNANGENFSSSQVKNWWAPTRERKFSELFYAFENNNPDFVENFLWGWCIDCKKEVAFHVLTEKKTVLVKYAVICRNLLSNCFVTTSTVKNV